MKKILITGGSGFIGTNLIEFLLKKKIKIFNIDKISKISTPEKFKPKSKNYFFKKIDLIETSKLKKLIYSENFDFIIHLAAESHVDRSIDSPKKFFLNNINSNLNLYDVVKRLVEQKKIKMPKIIHISTDEVYGSVPSGNPKNALNGKMPFYKFIGNFVLTKFFNLVFKTNFTDAHTGLWMYNLNNLNYNFFKDIDENFNFDNQLRIKLVKNKKQIDEIPIKTYYRNEKSSFHLIYALKFLLEVSKNIIK